MERVVAVILLGVGLLEVIGVLGVVAWGKAYVARRRAEAQREADAILGRALAVQAHAEERATRLVRAAMALTARLGAAPDP
jgi:hypothetical protein